MGDREAEPVGTVVLAPLYCGDNVGVEPFRFVVRVLRASPLGGVGY